MSWVFELHRTQPVAQAIGILALVCVLGMALGSMKFRGIGLGSAGVLFAGILVGHMPVNTNLAFREFGIVLFFATVGLDAGARFFSTAFSATGLEWLLAGLCVTMVPLLLVGCFARTVWKMNFIELSGLLAGSMTNPPGLAFASNMAGTDAPTVPYATVYPLTTLLRILSAQVLALTLVK
jgi:putative transport protein